jgi:hypothetical protein
MSCRSEVWFINPIAPTIVDVKVIVATNGICVLIW